MKTYAALVYDDAEAIAEIRHIITCEDIEAILPEGIPYAEVTAMSPAPEEGWTTTDRGKTFTAPPARVWTPTIRTATVAQLIEAMTDDQEKAFDAALSAGTLAMRTWWSAHYLDLVPENASKIIRLAGVAKVDLKALYDKIYASKT